MAFWKVKSADYHCATRAAQHVQTNVSTLFLTEASRIASVFMMGFHAAVARNVGQWREGHVCADHQIQLTDVSN